MPHESKVVFGGRFRVNMTFWRPPLFAIFVRDGTWLSKIKNESTPYFRHEMAVTLSQRD